VELWTLEAELQVRVEDGELIEGVLRCTGCARRYGVVDLDLDLDLDLRATLGS